MTQEQNQTLMDDYLKGITSPHKGSDREVYRSLSVNSINTKDVNASPDKLLSPSTSSYMRIVSPKAGNLPKMATTARTTWLEGDEKSTSDLFRNTLSTFKS
mmetsp:Transcript_2465/g.2326  ORF Transcript_2465/g.2326 Transcript_2465/m.2326 type:complete len:101 (+) Transcript_2465:255-557(+)